IAASQADSFVAEEHGIGLSIERQVRQPAMTMSVAGARRFDVWIVSAALIAAVVKLAIAYTTFGTNDAITFYMFARSLSDHGLEWTYQHGVAWMASSTLFNHPPLTAIFLRA